MLETKILTFRESADTLPDAAGESVALNVNIYLPETVRVIGEGWTPVSHQMLQFEDDLLITILVVRDTQAPDTAASLRPQF